jgi:hypothetical protein
MSSGLTNASVSSCDASLPKIAQPDRSDTQRNKSMLFVFIILLKWRITGKKPMNPMIHDASGIDACH